MQAPDDEGLGGTASAHAPAAYGLLEAPHGVVELVRLGDTVAHGRLQSRKLKTYDDLSCVFWKLRDLEWTHASALLFHQGASIQQLVTPFIVLRARPRPVYAVRPGLDDVLLVDVLSAPVMPRADLFVLLTARAVGI